MIIESFEHHGVRVELHYDEDPMDPREWDNLGTMLCNYRRYDLGDEKIEPGHYESLAELVASLREDYKPTVVLPLYILDHSGLAMSAGAPITSRSPEKEVDDTNHFISDPGGWDTSMVGFILDTEGSRKLMGYDEDVDPERIQEVLEGEVEAYDAYLQGQAFGYIVEGDDSCWGFFELDDCREQAKAAAERVAKERAKELAEANARDIAASATLAWNGEDIRIPYMKG